MKQGPASCSETELPSPSAPDEFLARFITDERRERLERVLSQRTRSLTIVLDRVHSCHNISAVLRSAEAFGLVDIHLVGSEFQHSRDISLGSERWLNLISHPTSEEALTALRTDGYELALLEPESKPSSLEKLPVFDLPFERRLALVFGNEHDGISPLFRAAAVYSVFIPMFGFVESLNISVACALALFCSTITGTRASKRPRPLSEQEKQSLRLSWLKKQVRGSELIVNRLKKNS